MKTSCWTWFLFSLLLAFSAHAESEKRMDIIINSDPQCNTLAVGFTVFSHHGKGDRGGALNEQNRGPIGMCYGKDRKWGELTLRSYSLVGALQNSRWGDTLVLGGGFGVRSPQFGRFSGELGYEVAATFYREGCASRGPYASLGCIYPHNSIVAPLPMYVITGNYELPTGRQILAPFFTKDEQVALPRFMQQPLGEISISRRTLGGGLVKGEKINLYTIMWTKRF